MCGLSLRGRTSCESGFFESVTNITQNFHGGSCEGDEICKILAVYSEVLGGIIVKPNKYQKSLTTIQIMSSDNFNDVAD